MLGSVPLQPPAQPLGAPLLDFPWDMPEYRCLGTAPGACQWCQSCKVLSSTCKPLLAKGQNSCFFPIADRISDLADVGSVAPGLQGGVQVILLPKGPWVAKLQLHPLGPWGWWQRWAPRAWFELFTDQFAATALKPLWPLEAMSANLSNPGHSFQLAVADSNVPLLGFILAFNDFYVGFDGVKGIAWECFVWTLVFSALSC